MKFLFCVLESDGVVDVEDVDACAGSHLNTGVNKDLSVCEASCLSGVLGHFGAAPGY